MQKDELIEVGVFKLAHSDLAKPERLPKEVVIQELSTCIFAGTVFTKDESKIASFLSSRYPDAETLTSK